MLSGCTWPTIAEEYAAGMSGPKLAQKYGVGSTRTIYLILKVPPGAGANMRTERGGWLASPNSEDWRRSGRR
jgi:hypothetical protein